MVEVENLHSKQIVPNCRFWPAAAAAAAATEWQPQCGLAEDSIAGDLRRQERWQLLVYLSHA